MDYDDIDVTMLDNRDSFGVVETSSPKILSNTAANSDRFFKKPPVLERISGKRESTDPGKPLFSKFMRKSKGDIDQTDSDKFHEKKNESKKIVEPLSVYKAAVTFQEKLSVLEDRDRRLREIAVRDKNMNTIAEGWCPDMCPEKERLLREINCLFSIFEGQIVQNEMHVVPELLVKEYARSSANQEEPLPHELRPEPVLIDTMSYLLMNIIPKIEEPGVDVAEWYNFCWDRLRSLRKDIIQQQLCSKKIVELLEQSARFHICCFDRLFNRESGIFDDKINAENLVNCLQMLITMYEDLEASGRRCVNECEFRIYMMLLLLDSNDLPGIPKWYNEDTRQRVEEITKIYFAFKLNLCTKFFKLVKKTHYLNACILQRYFTTIRAHTLNTLVNAYSPSSHAARFPLDFVKKILEIDNDEDAIYFVSHYSFVVNHETNEIRGSKASFLFPETKPACKSSYLIEGKRVPIVEAITKTRNYRADRKSMKVHSSFDESDVLKESAWNAEDQRAKVIDLYGNIYQAMEHSTSYISLQEISDDDGDSANDSEMPLVQTSNNLSNVATTKPETPKLVLPPPSTVFNFGAILPDPKRPDVVDASFKSTRMEPLAPPPCFPKIVTMGSNSFNRTSPVVEKPSAVFSVENASPLFPKPLPFVPLIIADEPSKALTTPEKPISIVRKPDEIVDSLTSALNQFEKVYWDHFGVSECDRLAYQRLQTLKENRKLRKVVKSRLKRINASKALRVWKRKVENRRKLEENFVGIIHLPPQEYFRLWGNIRKHENSNLVEEVSQSQSTAKWSRSLLKASAHSIRYMGPKLADHLIDALRRRQPSVVEGQLPLVICWKMMLVVSDSGNSLCRSFVNKLNEFCGALYYENEKKELGSVQPICTSFKRVLTSINVKTGLVDIEYVSGVSHLMIFANELWENYDKFVERVTGTCDNLTYAVYTSVIVIGECSYKKKICSLMDDLKRKQIISGWNSTKWKNFFTVPNVTYKACQYAPASPPFRVKTLKSFIETVGGEFFTHLFYIWADCSENSPTVFINLYNEFLVKLKQTLDGETFEKYNFSPEFLPHIVKCEDARSNLTDEEVPSLIAKYSLISFTKWPPRSVEKMIKLLKKYCTQIEDDNRGTLLPNMLRLVNVEDNTSVEDISSRTPWLKIVELWFRYRLCAVSKNENAEKVFIFYDDEKVVNVAKGLWIEKFLVSK